MKTRFVVQPAEMGKRTLWPLFTAGIFLTVWHVSVQWTASSVFPSPLDVERGMAELLRKGVLWAYIGDSLRRVGAGYLAAAALGIPLGLLLGWYPAAAAVVNPAIQILRPISPIACDLPVSIVAGSGSGRHGGDLPDLSCRLFPHRGRRHEWSAQRPLHVPPRRPEFRIVAGAVAGPRGLPRGAAADPGRTAPSAARNSPGWWWWRRR